MGYCLTQNIQINWTASVQKNQKTMCTKRILRSACLGHLMCALGLRCVSNAQRDAKIQGFLVQKTEDPDQNGRMPTHGEWMLFLKGAINNEWASLELPFSIEIHFCSKLPQTVFSCRYPFDDTHKMWTRTRLANTPLRYWVQKIWL